MAHGWCTAQSHPSWRSGQPGVIGGHIGVTSARYRHVYVEENGQHGMACQDNTGWWTSTGIGQGLQKYNKCYQPTPSTQLQTKI
jgi:hypothetical protein